MVDRAYNNVVVMGDFRNWRVSSNAFGIWIGRCMGSGIWKIYNETIQGLIDLRGNGVSFNIELISNFGLLWNI